MGYDPRSAAVIALCIGAVLVAAALFPVAGMDGGPTSGDAGVSSGPANDGSGTDDDARSGETDDGGGEGSDSVAGSGEADSDGEESGSETDRGDEQDAERAAETNNETPLESPDSSNGTVDSTVFRLGTVLLVGAGAVLLAGLVYAVRNRIAIDLRSRSNGGSLPLPDGRLPRLRTRLARIPHLTMIATIALARQATAVGSGLTALGGSALSAGRVAGRSIQLALGSVAAVSIGLPSIPRPRFPSIGWSRSNDGGADDRRRFGSASPSDDGPAAESDGYTEPETVEEAWRRLVSSLALRRPSVRTPRECAAIAIDAGLPREAVETVTEAFEAVRYGDAARTPARLERVRAAYERVRERGGDGQ